MISRNLGITSPIAGRARSALGRGGLAAWTVVLAFAGGCALPETSGPGDHETALLATRDVQLRDVAWSAGDAPTGKVSAVAEQDDTTVVFTDAGAALFSGGVTAGTDSGVPVVDEAAVIPAADHAGLWIAGAGADGKVWRLVAGEAFEAVSNLYGLQDDKVVGLSSMGASGTVFALPDSLAVSDGTTVTRYDTGPLAGLTASATRAAGAGEGGVATFDPTTGTLASYDVPGASAVAFDDTGRLLVLAPDRLYREGEDGALTIVYESKSKGLSELASSPGRVWFADGTRLGLIDEAGVGLAPAGSFADGGKLTGSPSGDVWVLAGGALSRHAVALGTEDERARWTKEIAPIFQASCTPCHAPNGVAKVVLSTYDTWVARHDKIRDRVVTKEDMPPTKSGLSDADRAVIAAWLDAN